MVDILVDLYHKTRELDLDTEFKVLEKLNEILDNE